MPKGWILAKRRRREACVPEEIKYKNKADLGREMAESALARGLEADWVLGDSIYGNDQNFRRFLEDRGRAYILGAPGNVRVWRDLRQWKLSDIAKQIPLKWSVLSCGQGTQKPRRFRWAFYEFPKEGSRRGWKNGIPFRQSLLDPEDMSYSRFFAPVGVSKQHLAEAAGKRRKVEECFQRAKGEVGLAEYEVRSWHGWHRHTALAM